ncbi:MULTISPECIES: hypothetical protein [Streptomyces]|uniref:hypothetical protein n=1 Tax=Streptomyces TaxID=1883 RepID=UPI0007CD55E6|nr:hypothetical protein A4V12_18485 [Streptomyces noursei]
MTHTEIEITAELVQGLLRDQHPDLADHPLALGALGWDNQLWRLGDDLAVRLPWATRSADGLLRKEHAWMPGLAPILLPDGAAERCHSAYRPAPDAATLRRARGWAALRGLNGILIGAAGDRGRPGGRPTWGAPARAALRRLIATAR